MTPTPMAHQTQNSGEAPLVKRTGVRNLGNQQRMISELERINALNLEPSLPKADEGNRNVSKISQSRADLKQDFQQFLKVMKSQDKAKGTGGGSSKGNPAGGGGNSAGDTGGRSSSTHANWTAQSAKQPAPAGGGPSMVPSEGRPSPNFPIPDKNQDLANKSVSSILDLMLDKASKVAPETVSPDWPEAKGNSYKQVLGQPNRAGVPNSAMQMMNMTGAGGPDPHMPQQQPQQHQQQQEPHHSRQPPNNGGNNNNNNNSHHGGGGNNNHRQQQQQQQNQDQQGGMRPMGLQGGTGPGPMMQPQGYAVVPGPGGPGNPNQQGGQQPQMMMFQGGPGMAPAGPQGQMMAGMMPQGMQFVQGVPGQQMFVPAAPNQQMAPMNNGMMVAQGPGGQNVQGMGISPMPGGFDGGGQQQQMMFVPMMMAPDQSGGFMQQPGMQQGYPNQQQGNNGNPQQNFMMQPNMYQQQGNMG